jgi:hypothetical protein
MILDKLIYDTTSLSSGLYTFSTTCTEYFARIPTSAITPKHTADYALLVVATLQHSIQWKWLSRSVVPLRRTKSRTSVCNGSGRSSTGGLENGISNVTVGRRFGCKRIIRCVSGVGTSV